MKLKTSGKLTHYGWEKANSNLEPLSFEEHRQTVIDDCFAGKLDSRILRK